MSILIMAYLPQLELSFYLPSYFWGSLFFFSVQAKKSWPSAETLLTEAVSKCDQTAKGKLRLSSFGLGKIPRWSCSLGEAVKLCNEAVDVVPDIKTSGRATESCIT